MSEHEKLIEPILKKYFNSFSAKVYSDENNDHDILMDIYGITPELKRENRQYWGRELGMLWQLIVTEICRKHCDSFKPAPKYGADEPCDLLIGRDAIDTKYRIGSGDAGTLKKFKQYGALLRNQGFKPVYLILREDNLQAAITACYSGGWTVLTGDKTFEFLKSKTHVDVKQLLVSFNGKFDIHR